MRTRIEVTPTTCRLSSGLLAARRLRTTDSTVRVALVATQALLLAGDHVQLSVDVRGDVALEVVETAGTVAYGMRGGQARWDVDVTLAAGARLTWLAEPFVVAAGADVDRSTTLTLAAGTSATMRESVVLGRTGETGGSLRVTTRASYDAVPLLVEDLDLSPSGRVGPAILGPNRCLDSITTLGHRLADGAGVLQLAGPGSLSRWIGHDQHRTGVVTS